MAAAKAMELLREAHAHHRAARWAEAAALYARVRALAPGSFDAFHLSGFLAFQQKRFAEAAALLERAGKLNPRSSVCALRLAHAQKALGKADAARAAAEAAVAADARNADAHFCLGELAAAREGFAVAVPYFRRVAELQPGAADGWANLGVALAQSGGGGEALGCFERALAIEPGNAQALTGRALALQQAHRVREAAECFKSALARAPGNFEARSARLLTLQYLDDVDRETMCAEHRAFGEAATTAVRKAEGAPAGSRVEAKGEARRLRVAFLSPDFRAHSVAYFIEPLLQHLDRERFEISLYHDHAIVDGTSERLRGLAKRWRNFAGWTNERVRLAMQEDAPDVLVDLAGHTGFNRLPLFARRLAPVQVTYLGYPDTTGMAEMDYRFTDLWADPEGEAERWHTEKLVRFAPTAWAYAPAADAPEPMRAGGGPVTFGCFNNFSKVSDTTLRVWARVLAEVSGARLLLKSAGLDEPEVRAKSEERLCEHGIDLSRVELAGRMAGRASHLGVYARVDVALDTFPYHGTTTTCEALWMGVPVVTLAGDSHRSRVGKSLLHAIGRAEWVAHSEVEYVRIAAELAAGGVRTVDASGRLREAVRASTLLDHRGQAERFGRALERCWSEARGAEVRRWRH